ncbi:MAG TPA: S8 family peptidase [Candidatus Acidoferrales bacterium]|nr:S8 family peptidase [Candidatus Acidoferrales bacterium]
MPETYPHLRLIREELVNPRRARPAPIRVHEPGDWRAFGRDLGERLQSARQRAARDLGGFDDRRLLKLELSTPLDPAEFEKISGEIEIVSEEDRTVILAFATEAALTEFEARLATLARGGRPAYRHLLFALAGFDNWTEEDRRGWALKQEGWPEREPFALDAELWPVLRATERDRSWQAFEAWLRQQGIEKLDAVKQAHLVLYRVRVNREQGSLLLRHRDVRLVDLPPRYGLEMTLLQTDIQSLPRVAEPPASAPGIVILDSGLTTGHPWLAPAVGDAQSFIRGLGPEDQHGHGTLVAGLALYGDVEEALCGGAFVPRLRLFSGRILDVQNTSDDRLIENQVDEAVRYFHREYGCRVFNLSYGDLHKPYDRGHVRGLAVTLDTLARELGVLFVVPTGNFNGTETVPVDWRSEYPHYLLQQEAALLDPAPALNALTVGSLGRWDASFNAQRYQNDPAEQPIARRDQPSPFSRSGPSVGGAVKPELVAYGGNWAVNVRSANQWLVRPGLGELSTCKDFAAGRLLAEDAGTSFAAPHVAHLAARILAEHPDADHNLLRALLVAHARWPESCDMLLPKRAERLRLCGYGKVEEGALERSTDQEVTLIANDTIPNRFHHFYEVPLPAEFLEGRPRTREVTVALAYSPAVRTTRISYKSCRMEFRLVWADDLSLVSRMFNAATSAEEYQRIPEAGDARIGARNRGAGTVQADTWSLQRPPARRRSQKLFVVVTRIDERWGGELTLTEEPYALAVSLRDRENAEARLYTQIQARLRARLQVRERR